MAVRVARLEDRVGVVPGLPGAADLADAWLVHALACLLDACDVPEADRRTLVASGVDSFRPDTEARPDAAASPARLDACRRALVFAALALEARLNRALRQSDASGWGAVARLAPAERFRLTPRLLDELGGEADGAELRGLVAELFYLRDELVDAGGSPGAALRDPAAQFTAARARAMVEASAEACCLLAPLTGEPETGTAQLVRRAAAALAHRAEHPPAESEPGSPRWDYDWGRDEFPPDLIGA